MQKSLWKRSKKGIGPAQWIWKSRARRIYSSRSIKCFFDTFFCSYGGSKPSIRLKEGEIGCSTLAAMSMTVAARAKKFGSGLPWARMSLR